MLDPHDEEFLKGLGFPFEVKAESAQDLVIIKQVTLPERYKPTQADILIKIPANYPALKLDMFYASPDITFATGAACPGTTATTIDGSKWQQWSRHLTEGQWRPAVDCLETYWFAVIWKELLQ